MNTVINMIARLFRRPPEFVIYGYTFHNGEEREMMRVRSREFTTEAAIRARLEITDQFRVTRVEMNP